MSDFLQAAAAQLAQRVTRDPATGCIEWTGFRNPRGYGMVCCCGRVSPAHRVAWEIKFGPIPAGLNVLHLCDRPSCVNVSHLAIGTQAANILDRDRKKRQARGERNGAARLTPADVVEIRAGLASGQMHRELGARFGVSRETITAIATGRTWATDQ